MDGSRFDAFSRRLAAAGTRRGLIKAALGLIAGGGVSAVTNGAEAAACRPAPSRCTSDERCCSGLCYPDDHPDRFLRGTCACEGGTTSCNGQCLSFDSDINNCGACGNACPAVSGNACLGAATCLGGACGFAAAPAGTACNDGNACTQNDACDGAGACMGGAAVVCAPLDACHDAGICNPANGACSHPAKPDGAECAGWNPCLTGASCQNGTCQGGTAVTCTTDNPCLTASCDPTQGCVTKAKRAGAACADDDLCDGAEACDGAGNCLAGAPVSCDLCNACDGGVCQPVADDASCATHCCNGVCCAGGEVCVEGICGIICTELGGECLDEGDCCQDGATFCDGACCHDLDGSCSAPGQCCSGRCQGGECCAGPNGECGDDGECCAAGLGVCDGGFCLCATTGQVCGTSFDCCDGLSCSAGLCQPDTCLELQEICAVDANCCQTGGQTDCAQSCGTDPFCCRPSRGACAQDCDCCGGFGQCDGNQCCAGEGGSCSRFAQDPGCCNGLTCVGSGLSFTGTCQLVCPAGQSRCGDSCCTTGQCCDGQTCCPDGRNCCLGACCTAGNHCLDGQCGCLGLQSDCDSANNACCQTEDATYCLESAAFGYFPDVCCRAVGGVCEEARDCCRNIFANNGRGHCGFDNLCGGDGAICTNPQDCVEGHCYGHCDNVSPVTHCLSANHCPDGGLCIELNCHHCFPTFHPCDGDLCCPIGVACCGDRCCDDPV